jgi:type 1 glutamine amidotransferase
MLNKSTIGAHKWNLQCVILKSLTCGIALGLNNREIEHSDFFSLGFWQLMKNYRTFLLLFLACLVGLNSTAHSQQTKILIVVGPSTHPPGTHEVAAGGQVMKRCIETMKNLPGVQAVVVSEWPNEDALLNSIGSIVFIGDFFPPTRMPESKSILAKLETMMQRGCGMACIHYATGIGGEDVGPDGDHPLLHWIGGYFANRSCAHHESFAKVFEKATIQSAAKDHPICRGWKPFTIHDEPYYNNYFGNENNKPAPNVTIIATSMLPPNSPKAEAVAWCVERANKGRGFGIVMPHFFKNWAADDLRMLIMNGIAWTAKLEVPQEGVQTQLVDLTVFGAQSVEPQTRPAKK